MQGGECSFQNGSFCSKKKVVVVELCLLERVRWHADSQYLQNRMSSGDDLRPDNVKSIYGNLNNALVKHGCSFFLTFGYF